MVEEGKKEGELRSALHRPRRGPATPSVAASLRSRSHRTTSDVKSGGGGGVGGGGGFTDLASASDHATVSTRRTTGTGGGFFGEEELTHDPEERRSFCLLYTSPSPRDATLSRMPSSA